MPPSRQPWYYPTGNFRRPKLHELWPSYSPNHSQEAQRYVCVCVCVCVYVCMCVCALTQETSHHIQGSVWCVSFNLGTTSTCGSLWLLSWKHLISESHEIWREWKCGIGELLAIRILADRQSRVLWRAQQMGERERQRESVLKLIWTVNVAFYGEQN